MGAIAHAAQVLGYRKSFKECLGDQRKTGDLLTMRAATCPGLDPGPFRAPALGTVPAQGRDKGCERLARERIPVRAENRVRHHFGRERLAHACLNARAGEALCGGPAQRLIDGTRQRRRITGRNELG